MNERERFLNDLFEPEYYKLFSYCKKRLYDEQAAEDCIDEVFFRAHNNADKLLCHPNPKGWVFKTTQLVLKEMQRKVKTHRSIVICFFNLDMMDQPNTPDLYSETSELSHVDIAAAKQTILSSLNERDRELYDLIYVSKLPVAELSEITSRPVPTLRVQKSRLREKLLRMVKEFYQLQNIF